MVVLRIANVQDMPGSTHYLDMAWTWAEHLGAGRDEYDHLPASWFVWELKESEDNSHLKQSYAERCVILSFSPSISYGDNSQK